MTVLIELRDVQKSFGGKSALSDVSLKIEEGEILALLGPNGSGKTTLLKTLAFLEMPDRGEISFNGLAANEKTVETLRLQSVLVFQRTLLFGTSVFNNVAYGLRIRKVPKPIIDEEVANALQLVRLQGFEQRPAKKLSGGEQQRVALARALVLKTKLLLLDEPTANLDPKNTNIVEEVILEANRQMKTTVVIATHNMFQAEKLPTRIALINEGRITEIGDSSEIFGKLSRSLAHFASLENTYTGTAKDTGLGTISVDLGNGVFIEVTGKKSGKVRVYISPQDIILSKNPVDSSARNVLRGNVTAIADSGNLVKLTIDVGKPFKVQITKRSFDTMGLNLNSEVYIAFKASSVQVI